ncbi:hypothetical protein B6U80_00815 [Candidatus Pacearchaeota archaeon ex4484_26]|nr:MAG: hypothetical protein B6U80_00815 [Candidatus Pacearchaeota archaeon ex4484_26]
MVKKSLSDKVRKEFQKGAFYSLLVPALFAPLASCTKPEKEFSPGDIIYLDHDLNVKTPDKEFKIEGNGKIYNVELDGQYLGTLTPEELLENYKEIRSTKKEMASIESYIKNSSIDLTALTEENSQLVKRAFLQYRIASEAQEVAQRNTPNLWKTAGEKYKEFTYSVKQFLESKEAREIEDDNIEEIKQTLDMMLGNIKFDAIIMASKTGDSYEIRKGDDILKIKFNKITLPDPTLQNDDYNAWAIHGGYAKMSLELNGKPLGYLEHYTSKDDIYLWELFKEAYKKAK